MLRLMLAAGLLAALSLVPAGVTAGPPDRPSGRMALDEVADALRRYRSARTAQARVTWLRKLAPIKDARVALMLGEAVSSEDDELRRWAIGQVYTHYESELPDGAAPYPITSMVRGWWRQNEADLRRRAALLPR
jgi:hypothetical protein